MKIKPSIQRQTNGIVHSCRSVRFVDFRPAKIPEQTHFLAQLQTTPNDSAFRKPLCDADAAIRVRNCPEMHDLKKIPAYTVYAGRGEMRTFVAFTSVLFF